MNTSHAADVYPDLLENDVHGSLTKVVVDLATIYQSAGAPASLRKSIDSAVLDTARRKTSTAPLSVVGGRRVRLGAGALAGAALILAVGIVGYAVAPLIDRLLTSQSGVSALPMHDIGLAQTSSGITVKVDRAYADANRVIVAYTIQVPRGFANSTSGIDGKTSLTDASGRILPLIDATGLAGSSPQVNAGLLTFDAESLPGGTATDTFLLAFPQVSTTSVTGGAPLVAGAFSFKFDLAVAPGREITVAKTVVTSGVPVTLDRVVITPSETRLYLVFPAGSGIKPADWNANAHLSGSGWDSRQVQLPIDRTILMTTGAYFINSHGEHVTTFSGDFRGHHGEWTVTVDSLWGVDSSAASLGTQGSEPKQAREAGPWTFKLLVP
ncbi:MAG: DUF4179 domain-containing protein [Candidatus Dormibacteraeota bacterium]|nr:DUF4179 domain-containing protein [Candidatus Dormibacteraeota bacterium]